jgi:hypothetical protein
LPLLRKALELGVKVVYAEEVRKETSASILTNLVSATEHDEWKNPLQFKLRKDSLGSIFVASDNELIYSKVVNGVETRGDSITVIGQESWLTDTSIDYSKFERTRVNLAAPNYRAVNSPAYVEFRKKFIQKHGLLPGEYATLGYEVTMMLGQFFSKYGAHFLELMPPGEIQPGTWARVICPCRPAIMDAFRSSVLRKVPLLLQGLSRPESAIFAKSLHQSVHPKAF